MRIQLVTILLGFSLTAFSQSIPLPEHPRPDFERANWMNLNGVWDFEFDSLNIGIDKKWPSGNSASSLIAVKDRSNATSSFGRV